MTDGDQERFEDYLELEAYIEALQAGKFAHPPANLTLEQARIYQMATLFRSATDQNAEPRPEFVADLKAQLLEMSEQQQLSIPTLSPPPVETLPLPSVPSELSVPKGGKPKHARFFSRRGILTGGAAAAASLVVGAGIGHEVQKSEHTNPSSTSVPNYPTGTRPQLSYAKNIPTTWHFVTTLADLGDGAVRFTASTIVGYVLRNGQATDANKGTDKIIALSAACTHMGCLVQWEKTEHYFSCPCHGALFSDQGSQLATDYKYALPPLPGLNTKIEDGKIYVEVPL